MSDALADLERTLAGLKQSLLARRNAKGVWEGRLAGSALSTATAVIALQLAGRASDAVLVRAGLGWLLANQNEDGGWGDTVRSFSNISTTALAWSAVGLLREADERSDAALGRAEAWLVSKVGALEPERLRVAIIGRYGDDRTFSVPILTAATLAGRLGSGKQAWRRIPQLPFELAACPHQIFEWLRLPVVSYALPALIALGHVRHRHAPTRNPLLRGIRSALRSRTLDVLRSMQPVSGGYLEATPLTSFVVMSLVSCGEESHPVVSSCLRFLASSARSDGSWPIDTNLATWVTTLSANALAGDEALSSLDRSRIAEWLLGQQLQEEHPYTHAGPGGWAWTDLSGGVPDADDTAGALLALSHLAPLEQRAHAAAARGTRFLLGLQNTDGGIPTFCRGWGRLAFDRSAPDLTAHALLAWSAWHDALEPDLRKTLSRAARRALGYLVSCQADDGSWAPLWFGNQHVPGEANFTYGTARTIAALASDICRGSKEASNARDRGMRFLLRMQNRDGGWGGGPGAPSSIEEAGLALHALASSAETHGSELEISVRRGAAFLVDATGGGSAVTPSPIGLYFARLWYFEDMYPLVFAAAGLRSARLVLTPRAGA